jgi:hypothetical protein
MQSSPTRGSSRSLLCHFHYRSKFELPPKKQRSQKVDSGRLHTQARIMTVQIGGDALAMDKAIAKCCISIVVKEIVRIEVWDVQWAEAANLKMSRLEIGGQS